MTQKRYIVRQNGDHVPNVQEQEHFATNQKNL